MRYTAMTSLQASLTALIAEADTWLSAAKNPRSWENQPAIPVTLVERLRNELATLVPSPPEAAKKSDKHRFVDTPGTFRDSRCKTCNLERNYYWHTNPNYPGAPPEAP